MEKCEHKVVYYTTAIHSLTKIRENYFLFFFFFLAKIYIDKKLKRHSCGETEGFLSDIFRNSPLTKKELYAAITELQIGGVETVSRKNSIALSIIRILQISQKKNSI